MDDDDHHNPGFKYAHWEVKGTPIRIEIGRKDMAAEVVTCAIRHDGKKFTMKQSEIIQTIPGMLETIH